MTRADKVISALVAPVATPVTDQGEAGMKRYGMKRIPVDYFRLGSFHYTSLKHAIAWARRAADAAGDRP